MQRHQSVEISGTSTPNPSGRIIMQKSFQQLGNYENNFFNLLMATPAVLFIGSRTRAWLKSANKK
jgi:hypothetical protein